MNPKVQGGIKERLVGILKLIQVLPIEDQIETINQIKRELHEASPFKGEPVDCVLWVKAGEVFANDYNPNTVAPPEMELLKVSIRSDGYTQPIVTYPHDNSFEVVDGFHRTRVGKEDLEIQTKIRGYLPITIIRA